MFDKEFTTEEMVRSFAKGLFGMEEADTLVVIASDKKALRRVTIGDTFKCYGVIQFVATDINRLLSQRTEACFGEDAEMVQIPKKELEALKEEREFLNALKSAGVSSWVGYETAQEIMDEEKRG
jgi:hypothetical protein